VAVGEGGGDGGGGGRPLGPKGAGGREEARAHATDGDRRNSRKVNALSARSASCSVAPVRCASPPSPGAQLHSRLSTSRCLAGTISVSKLRGGIRGSSRPVERRASSFDRRRKGARKRERERERESNDRGPRTHLSRAHGHVFQRVVEGGRDEKQSILFFVSPFSRSSKETPRILLELVLGEEPHHEGRSPPDLGRRSWPSRIDRA
jgi:hypothetical protein